MADVPEAASGLSWFVALPDTDAGDVVLSSLRQRAIGLQMITHGSGRPWLVGRWADDEAAVATFGDRRLVVIGEHRLRTSDLLRLGAHARDPADLCAAVRDQPGSFHVLAATRAGSAAQGSLSGFRRVYFTTAGDAVLVSDRADVLAALTGSDVDEESLALRLLAPYAPWPLFWQPVWRGVHAVRPDERLILTAGAAPRATARWHPPEPVSDLATAAARLRDALSDAVAVRVHDRDVIASDLSGVDSTALCSLAVRTGTRVVGLTCVSPDPLDDDLPWARRASVDLGGVIHEVVDGNANPLPYDGVGEPTDRFDEPSAAVMYRAGFLAVSRRAAAHGARVRLTGFGGDELLTTDPVLQVTLLRTHPGTALRQLWLMRAAYRWGRRETLRALLDRRSYATWMASLADGVGASGSALSGPLLAWGAPVWTAPWVVPDGRRLLQQVLRERATEAVPLVNDRGLHGRLAGVYAGAAAARHLAQTTRRIGVSVALPYLDDQVVDACLAAPVVDVSSPRDYKPLARAAMRGVVPTALLERTTKADTSIAADRGARRHRADLLALSEDSRLAERGLIDAAALRAAIEHPHDRTWYDLDQTLACETWLRSLEARAGDPLTEER
ncbi:asparagine synthase-related protein [Micromonospora inaquosa]|uniref:asparagine synthase (glutamine-hydrolyzing) n=1 Tax=Micromonospora inaquosa TaxID=2203716 RepID=A0A3N9X0B5_9ACTN|nr:asparagine synthase-related protein [Micromonospora inaquosa]RQX06382.1 asparagine synthase [Micromonospora inaquosa]